MSLEWLRERLFPQTVTGIEKPSIKLVFWDSG